LKANSIFLFFFAFCINFITAQTATIKGKVFDHEGNPIENVSITYDKMGTTSNFKGEYSLSVPSGKPILIKFSHLSYVDYLRRVNIPKGKTLNFSPKLNIRMEEINEVILKNERTDIEGITVIKTDIVKNIPSANNGIESVLKTLPGVSFNNEMSTQYNVRGGSFDENLVYVNGIEIYRPFLIRSGQQEGLSFVNPNLTQKIEFSAGGFQAKYGDKLSSVLDITYRKPTDFGIAIEASLLGASVTVEAISKNKKLKGIVGARYRNNSLFVNSKNVISNYDPNFTDIQAYLSYEFNEKFTLDFLGNYALNNYNFNPISQETSFGTLLEPKALVVNYRGRERDKYETIFGSLSGIYKFNDDFNINLTASTYNTKEQEYYDILAFYGLGDVNTDFGSESFGDIEFVEAIGSQLDHARNNLEAQISNISLKATLRKNSNLFEIGAKYQYENIKDRIIEWQVIDSAGFSIRPPYLLPKNDEPYTPFTGPIEPFINVRAQNNVDINRITGFAQWSKKTSIQEHTVWFNVGIRGQHWTISGEGLTSENHVTISPRAQFTIKPAWDKDMLFRVSVGIYHQPPFYRELRDSLGIVHPDVNAQKSFNFVLANDYSLKLWDRPFKLVSEIYYKKLSEVNPFTIDNVKIRYRAKNNAIAYAAGFDLRLNGEFVPGTESWFSFGYLKTEENIDDRGYISRPTDQRLKFAILFQDYVPSIPALKMYLNMVYNTGVPGGSPSYADPYLYQNRLKDYHRADIGISYVLVDKKNIAKKNWQKKFKELSAGIELFNMFDVQNSITNTWVRDISSKHYIAVPNYLSGRVLNIKIAMRF